MAALLTTDLALFCSEMSAAIKAQNANLLVYIGIQGKPEVGGASPYKPSSAALIFAPHTIRSRRLQSTKFRPAHSVLASWASQCSLTNSRMGQRRLRCLGDSDKDNNGLPAIRTAPKKNGAGLL